MDENQGATQHRINWINIIIMVLFFLTIFILVVSFITCNSLKNECLECEKICDEKYGNLYPDLDLNISNIP